MPSFKIYRLSLICISLSLVTSLKAAEKPAVLEGSISKSELRSFPSVNYDANEKESRRHVALIDLETGNLTAQQKADLAIIAKVDPSDSVRRLATAYLAGEESLATRERKDAEARQTKIADARKELERILGRMQQLGATGTLIITNGFDGHSQIDSSLSKLFLFDGESFNFRKP